MAFAIIGPIATGHVPALLSGGLISPAHAQTGNHGTPALPSPARKDALQAIPASAGTATAETAETPLPCGFDRARLSFAGSKPQQAACLLRRVGRYGVPARQNVEPLYLAHLLALPQQGITATPGAGDDAHPSNADIPRPLTPALLRPAFENWVANAGISPDRLGGNMARGLSQNRQGDRARYFVIHDTSSPYFGQTDFPLRLNRNDHVNDLSRYSGPNAAAHVFVNRGGDVYLGHDFALPWRATKLELHAIGISARGLFLHIELVQPRRADPQGPAHNDAIAPIPGFSPAQYDALATLYLAASIRAGDWLIPAFHANLDALMADGHDDPQNFDLRAWENALEYRITQLLLIPPHKADRDTTTKDNN